MDIEYVSIEQSRAGYAPEAEDGYDSLKVADLKSEIDKRNEGRDEGDLISGDGIKADLVAALEADDNK